MQTVNLVFRKPTPHQHSIETVFNALLPYFSEEFKLNRIILPFETRGVNSMRKNLKFLRQYQEEGITHVTGHDHYMVKAGGSKTILTIHDIGSALTGRRLRDSYVRYNWFRMPVSRAKAITMISDFTANEFLDIFPYAKEKIRVIPNPVDDRIKFSNYDFNQEHPNILQIGTKENKNLERVAMALEGIACTLTILGKLSTAQMSILTKHNIRFENHYHLAYKEVQALYTKADIVLFASLYEGFGMPILEAQASGRPLITSNIGVMPGTAGMGAHLINPYRYEAIREAVQILVSDPAYRKELIEKGRENVARYSARTIASQYMDLYNEISG